MFAASLTFLGIVAAASGRAAEPLSLPIAASSARAGATTPATGVGGAAVQWSGSYIGMNYVMGGGAAALSDPVGLGLKGVGMTGPAYGGTIGYDYLFGQGVVAGVAADIDISRASGSYRSTETLSSGSLAPTASWALRGRIGASVGDASLVYGTAGYSRALETLDIESPNLTWRGTKSF